MKKLLFTPDKDLRLRWAVLVGLALLLAKLFLTSAQEMYLEPEGAVLDDMLMYNSAVNIVNGKWLGPYNWLTLSKHSFFALWLALLHWLHIPYLLAGQLLWAAAAFAAARAVAPALKKRFLVLALFGVLLFNPASTANPQPYGYMLRVYRDNIFPSLCLLCIAGVVGYALRYKQPLKKMVGWPVLAGVALAACWLTREDGWWLLPFVLVASVVTLDFILRSKAKNKLKRCLLLLVPFVVLAMGDLAWRGMNYRYYGRFIISDFSSGEFADAYGAMTRITHEDWHPKIDVPIAVREQLYQHVPAFAELAPLLESPRYLAQYADKDYSSGAFYWALRQAAGEAGYYDTPQKAKEYFEGLARDINALCDEGVLPAGPQRSSVNPPIKPYYVGAVLKQGVKDFAFCVTFRQCNPRSMFSPHSNDPAMYQQLILPMEEFLHDKAQTVTLENSCQPYFSPVQHCKYVVLDAINLLYAVLTPLAVLAAFLWQVLGGVRLFKQLRKKQANPAQTLLWLVQLGLFLCLWLRVAMIAFVSVSSFTIGTYIMYLASVHPLLLLYGFIGTVQLLRHLAAKRPAAAKKEAA